MGMKKRFLAMFLAGVMTLSGCAGGGGEETSAQLQTTQALPTIPALVTDIPARPEEYYPVDWARHGVIYEVNIRQYTEEGTFDAFSAHLQTLKDMGITTLWFMPIHPISETKRSGTLGSYYSVTDYRAVNPEFGTAEDFRELVDRAHAMGFTVIMDWVANHTGWDCPWIREHPEWYTKDKNGNITDPPGMGWPDVADLDFSNPELRAEMIACMKYWVEEYDMDGFRCDYAAGVPRDFWELARVNLETVKPILMLAEDNSQKQLLNYAFDCNYNWELYDTLLEIAGGSGSAYFIRNTFPANYPDGTWRLNFLDNHDKNSWERTIRDAFGVEALPCLWALTYTLPGTPLVYSGDEIGLDHNIAFMERDPIDWESSDVDYRPLLTELAAIRRENPALHSGNYGGAVQYTDIDRRAVMAFRRNTEGSDIYCLFNLTGEEIGADLSMFLDGTGTVLLHGAGSGLLETEDSEAVPSGTITLEPWEFWIIRKS